MNIDEAYQHLKRGFNEGRAAHAYIIVGPLSGDGGELVHRLMQLLLCVSEEKPCGDCRGCRQALEHSHPDLFWLEPQKKTRIISIDQIRDLQRNIYQTSFTGGVKVCVIVGADRMRAEAANAFLKTLEEPPDRCLLLLLTESPQFLLPTIVSRCQRVVVSTVESDIEGKWRDNLVGIVSDIGGGAGVRTFAMLNRLCGLCGEMREAAGELEKEISGSEKVEEEDGTFDARVEARYRGMRQNMVRSILKWYRDILLLVAGGKRDNIHYTDMADVLESKAQGLTYGQALRNVEIVERMNRQLDRNVPEQVVFSAGLAALF